MSPEPEDFERLLSTYASHGAVGVVDQLVETLRAEKNYHALFDGLLMKKRLELGLPLARPTSLKDVPEALAAEFEQHYVDVAREIGSLLLAQGSIAQAWNYFRAINEPQKVAQAIEALEPGATVEESVIELALFHGVAPVKGLELFLASHGTCSTITALDQHFLQMTPEIRRRCAQVLVRKLYGDLRDNIEHDVRRKQPDIAAGQSLHDLLSDRDWLTGNDAYHIDVSHLNASVRFARALDADCPELTLAMQLAEYGSRLSSQYQYSGNPPFEDFYPAHIRYFQALAGIERDAALRSFRDKLSADASSPDDPLVAYTLVELLTRLGKTDEALDLACRYLKESADEFGLSLAEMCATAGRFDRLQELAREKGDLVSFASAIIGRMKDVKDEG